MSGITYHPAVAFGINRSRGLIRLHHLAAGRIFMSREPFLINIVENWTRSSRCGPRQADCVEFHRDGDAVAVRDSKAGENVTILVFSSHSWSTFLTQCGSTR